MDEIDELARLLLVQEDPDAGGALWDGGSDRVRQAYRARAAEIVRAGFRRRRPVATVEELAALPAGSVVMTRHLGGVHLGGLSIVATRGLPAEEFYGYPWTVDGHPGHYSHEGLAGFLGTRLEVIFEPGLTDSADG